MQRAVSVWRVPPAVQTALVREVHLHPRTARVALASAEARAMAVGPAWVVLNWQMERPAETAGSVPMARAGHPNFKSLKLERRAGTLYLLLAALSWLPRMILW